MIGRWLRVSALVLLLAATSVWFFTGAGRGWTRTSVPVRWTDEVTGIEGIRYEPGFQPGLDFLGAAAVGAGILAATSLLIKKQENQRTKT